MHKRQQASHSKFYIKFLKKFTIKHLTKSNYCAIIYECLNLGVAQLVARYLGVVEAASSSLVTQTSIKTDDFCHPFFAFLRDRLS